MERAAHEPAIDILDSPRAGALVIRGGTVRGVAYFATILLSLGSAPLLTRHLGAVDFGRFVTVTSLVTIVAGLTDAGLTNVGVREYSVRAGDARVRMLRNLMAMRTALTVAGIAAALLFALGAGYTRAMVLGTAVAGAGLLLAQLQTTLTIPLTTRLRLGWVSMLEFFRQAVYVGAVVVLVAVGAGLLPFFAAPVLAAVAVLLATMAVVRSETPVLPRFDADEWRALLRDTLPYAAASAIGVIYFRAAILILSVDAPGRETGYFSASFRIYEVIAGVAILLILSTFPILSRAAFDDAVRLRYVMQRVFEVALMLGVGLALVTGIGARVIIRVIAGSGYGPAIAVLQIESAAVVATFLVATLGYTLLSLRHHRALLVANGTALVVVVTLSLTLIPGHGAKGAAFAVVATEVALAFMYALTLARTRPDLRFPLVAVPRVAVAAAAGLAAGLFTPIGDLGRALVAGAVYAAGLAVLGAIPPELREALWPRTGK